ncbi:MAG: hypothetical protein AMQ22_01448 [Candidatus Methanofastidiosum methylothiophilum]|uniref:Transcription factor zinc-finger domain-containing protein n=1 Tax=Candidatus Methanofastidiosum methylothiophilum TaxID=1705564 RepID=A0A150IZS1_9EURY|nr:MAG: hypothetical protein AMQ22_01448 [Candidatus Methanofastidiosum methylthiophilus]
MPLKCPDCYTPMKQDVLSGEKWHCCPDCGTGFSDEIYQETSYQRYLWKKSKFKKIWNSRNL